MVVMPYKLCPGVLSGWIKRIRDTGKCKSSKTSWKKLLTKYTERLKFNFEGITRSKVEYTGTGAKG